MLQYSLMRTAYMLLGMGFLLVFGAGAYLFEHRAHAPTKTTTTATITTTTTLIPHTQNPMALSLTSTAFEHNGPIPEKYTCDGEDTNPPLDIAGVPDGTQSLVLIMEDPDVPKDVREDGMWDHWVVFNIAPSITHIESGETIEGTYGVNTRGQNTYGGPCPPRGTHRYFFKLYALDADVPIEAGASKEQVLDAMTEHILDTAELIGTYARSAS